MALYDSVVKKRPKQRIRPLWIVLLVICLLALLTMGLVISKPQRDHDRFIDCMGALSDSTSYTFRTKIPMLRATVDGQELRISEENGYALYKKLFNTNFLAFSSDIPEGESVRLVYEDGAVLELWPYALGDGAARGEGIFVRLVTAEGKQYAYYSDRDTLSKLTSCLSPEKNTPWEDGFGLG